MVVRLSAALLIALAGIHSFARAADDGGGPAATLNMVTGIARVLKKGDNSMVIALPGLNLEYGDKLVVVTGKAMVTFRNGSQLRISKGTTIEIREPASTARGKRLKSVLIGLVNGTIRAVVRQLDFGDDFIVVTEHVVSAVKGTDFLFDGSMVTVFDEGDAKEHSVEIAWLDTKETMVVKEGQVGGFTEDGIRVEPADLDKGTLKGLDEEYGMAPAAAIEQKKVAEAGLMEPAIPGAFEKEQRGAGAERDDLRVERIDLVESRQMAATGDRVEWLADKQTERVLTDVRGYRVRLEEYVFRPSLNTVEAVYLNQRDGGPNSGLTFMLDTSSFNRDLPELFQDTVKNVAGSMANPAVVPEYWITAQETSVKNPSGDSFRVSNYFSSPELKYSGYAKCYNSSANRWDYVGETGPVSWGQSLDQRLYIGTSAGETMKERFSYSKYLDLNGGWYAGASPALTYPAWAPSPGTPTVWSAVTGFYPYDPAMDNSATAADEGRPDFGNLLFGSGTRAALTGDALGMRTQYGDGSYLVEKHWFINDAGTPVSEASMFTGVTTKKNADDASAGTNIERRYEASEFTGAGRDIDIVVDPRLSQ